MTYDGNNNYQYDAQDRLVMITYSGTGNNTQFTYDGLGHWVKSVETTNNAVTSTVQYLWSGDKLMEERDGSGNVLKRFFDGGEQVVSGGTTNNYYYVRDHLGSIRQMTNSSGAIVYQADYDAYGTLTITTNTVTPAFGYAGYFVHARSGLNLTVHRAYDSTLARFINRDPIAESGGINLYGYVGADPLGGVDGSGLQTLQGYISNDDEGSGSAGISAGSGSSSPLSGGTSCNSGGSSDSSASNNSEPYGPSLPPLLDPGIAEPDPITDNLIVGGITGFLRGVITAIQGVGSSVIEEPFVYAPRLSTQKDLYHNFPRLLDKVIVYGGKNTLINGRYKQYELPGFINGKPGKYEIGINGNTIVHRLFSRVK